MPGDIFHIKVTLLHQNDLYLNFEYVQESHYKWWLPDFHSEQDIELYGDILERKARLTIDRLLEWRRDNHKHETTG